MCVCVVCVGKRESVCEKGRLCVVREICESMRMCVCERFCMIERKRSTFCDGIPVSENASIATETFHGDAGIVKPTDHTGLVPPLLG